MSERKDLTAELKEFVKTNYDIISKLPRFAKLFQHAVDEIDRLGEENEVLRKGIGEFYFCPACRNVNAVALRAFYGDEE